MVSDAIGILRLGKILSFPKHLVNIGTRLIEYEKEKRAALS